MIIEYKYQDKIHLRPEDNPRFDADWHDLSDPDEAAWWQRWCDLTGEFQRLQITHDPYTLELIARRADYNGWDDVSYFISDAYNVRREMEIMAAILWTASRYFEGVE